MDFFFSHLKQTKREREKERVIFAQIFKSGANWCSVFFQTCAHRYIQENAALGVCYTLLQTLEFQSKWIPCMGQPHTRYLEDFGLCQAGLSAALGPHEAMVIGSPGPIVWRGENVLCI